MKDRDRKTTEGQAHAPVPPMVESHKEKSSFPWKVAGGGALALLLIWFVIQNSHSVQVNLFWWSGEYPMILLMAAVAVSAILVWETLSLWRRRKKQAGGKE